MTATATRETTQAQTPSARAVVLTLAHFEGRQMLRHPLLWIGALASVGLAVFELIEEAPVLNRASMTLAWTMAPLAVAAALISGWAVLRARARDDAKPPIVTPVAMDQRVAGVALGLIYPGLATFVIQMGLLAWLMTRDPVTSIVWTELLVGPLYVVFAGTVTAALTRWVPHAITPLMSLLALGVVQAIVPYHDNWGTIIDAGALAPIYWPQATIPYELTFRPASLHLLYLGGLVFVLAALATLGRRAAPLILFGIGSLIAVGFGMAQLGPIDESTRQAATERLVGETANVTCETRDPIRYCAMPGYEGWIEAWDRGLRPILAAVPVAIHPFEVRQYPVHNPPPLGLEDSAFGDEYWWLGPSREDLRRREVVPTGTMLADFTIDFYLSGAAASRIVGCSSEGLWGRCPGEAQDLTRLWLLSHNRAVRADIEYDTSPASDYASVYSCMVAELWQRPDEAELVRINWALLTSPTTSLDEAGELLGLSVPESNDEHGGLRGGCP
jgi:hypothetical protein